MFRETRLQTQVSIGTGRKPEFHQSFTEVSLWAGAAPAPNFNVVDSGVWKFEIEQVIIEIGGVGGPQSCLDSFTCAAPSLNGGWKRRLDPARFWKTNSASPPVVERYLLLLMFASFFLRVMCLTNYKTIQGIAVRRFPSSLVMLGYCLSRERLRRVPFKKSPVIFICQSSSSHHHHLIIIIIIIIISSSSHHHHLLIIISPSSSSFPSLSLSLAFLFFSNLAQPSSHEKRARCNPSQGKCVSSVKN